jgi:hypothetical protein
VEGEVLVSATAAGRSRGLRRNGYSDLSGGDEADFIVLGLEEVEAIEEVFGGFGIGPVVAGVVDCDVVSESSCAARGGFGEVVGIEEHAVAGLNLSRFWGLLEGGSEVAVDRLRQECGEGGPREKLAALLDGGTIWKRRSGGQRVELPGGYVRDEEREGWSDSGDQCEASALDRREVLPDAVDLRDRGAAVNQSLVEDDCVFKRDGWVEGEFHHRGCAAADEEEAERVGESGGFGDEGEGGFGSVEGGLVGEGMAAGEELDGVREAAGPVTGDQDTFELTACEWDAG